MSEPLVFFTAYGVPAPSGSKTSGRTSSGVTYLRPASKRQKPWQRDVAQAAGIAMMGRTLLEGPLRLDAIFFRPRPKDHYKASGGLSAKGERSRFPESAPDTTKLVRAVEDAIQGIVVRNDASFVKVRGAKVWGEPARAMVEVREA